MEFKLKLIPELPTQFVLLPEKKLCGVKLLEEAARCLRRNLDGSTRCKHTTLGQVYCYEISVPQQVAIESGYFVDTNCKYLVCEQGILNQYIFHAAAMTYGAGNRCYYPYYQDELNLQSYIDELAFIDTWRNRGYPDKMSTYLDNDFDLPLVPDADDVDNPEVGDCVLDDITRGDS